MSKQNIAFTTLLFIALIGFQSISRATNRYQYPDSQNNIAESWYDWAKVVRIEPEIKIMRTPPQNYECDNSDYGDSRFKSRNNNPLGVSDAVRYHLEKAEGRSFNSRQQLTAKQRYQQKKQYRNYGFRNNTDCRNSNLRGEKRIRYYRICYVYRDQEYFSMLNYYPEAQIRVRVTAIPANRQRFGEPLEYSYEVTPVDHRF